jgi:putative holliday junction resolvase
MPNERTWLGFDFGPKKIGVALANSVMHQANPLTVLPAVQQKPDWSGITTLLSTWKPNALIVGLPCNMDGTPHQMTAAAQRFSRQLNGRFNLPVHLQDERLTSKEATVQWRERQRQHPSRKKPGTDALAASLILQSWLDHPQEEGTLP